MLYREKYAAMGPGSPLALLFEPSYVNFARAESVPKRSDLYPHSDSCDLHAFLYAIERPSSG